MREGLTAAASPTLRGIHSVRDFDALLARAFASRGEFYA
jgi:hypothetical protein